MPNGNLFVSDLSTSRHVFANYHFCRGNSNRRKTRLGLILKGCGSYVYLNKKLTVETGDVVLIPENIYCYSEWRGDPEIEVVYLSCFLHYEGYKYEPQILSVGEGIKQTVLEISELLSGGRTEILEAYSRFYRVLQTVLAQMKPSEVMHDKTLQTAIEYIAANWDRCFSVPDLAKKCCVSESTLYHLFQRELGQTPIGFLHSIRINVAIQYLENTDYSIATISRMVCFPSENHFRRVFADYTGTTPLKFRKNR